MKSVGRLWNATSRTERWVWLFIILAAIAMTVAFQDLEGFVLITGAVSWRLIWMGGKRAFRAIRLRLRGGV